VTLENLTWAMIGFLAGTIIVGAGLTWAMNVISNKWLQVVTKNRKIYQESVNRAWGEGYKQALIDEGLISKPTNEAGSHLREVGATPIAED